MKKKIFYWAFGVCFLLLGCTDRPARRPVTVKTNTFLKESAKKNKELLKEEEKVINSIIAQDTLNTYVDSEHGFKYHYIRQNPEATYTAKFGDIVTYTYGITNLEGKTIYEITPTPLVYYVDKEELFYGLRTALKILKENETARFFFPSEIAFGYHGDKNKIGSNQPIIVEVTILKIEKEEKSTSENQQ
ncbi:gliding motility-associated peptidyl-prolyl isomerase GldI [Capnocytophaga canimorsus]|uniref:gliding motility-associated peptidyl-prolyl isomerase GldI n=1 Tax=Capnocytophaga canimorsus TaxID=28188 RepID=UPI001EDEC598|nr:gliding motility-associated peptidyl-prolyl isomerase GldI [Capnocytophaga canimorsus]GJQ04617.1 peptidyl-prolyl cis-trans isomerase [Capnocytophaga canimorsus]